MRLSLAQVIRAGFALVIAILVIVAMAVVLAARGKSATDFAHASWLAPLNFGTAILWGTIVFAYSGQETAGMIRNEIRGGIRTIVRALMVAFGWEPEGIGDLGVTGCVPV